MKILYTSGTCAQSVDRSGLLCLSPTFFAHHVPIQAIRALGRSWGAEEFKLAFPRIFILRPLGNWVCLQKGWPTLVEETEVRHA
jgi:hypothetical protein